MGLLCPRGPVGPSCGVFDFACWVPCPRCRCWFLGFVFSVLPVVPASGVHVLEAPSVPVHLTMGCLVLLVCGAATYTFFRRFHRVSCLRCCASSWTPRLRAGGPSSGPSGVLLAVCLTLAGTRHCPGTLCGPLGAPAVPGCVAGRLGGGVVSDLLCSLVPPMAGTTSTCCSGGCRLRYSSKRSHWVSVSYLGLLLTWHTLWRSVGLVRGCSFRRGSHSTDQSVGFLASMEVPTGGPSITCLQSRLVCSTALFPGPRTWAGDDLMQPRVGLSLTLHPSPCFV